MLHRTLTCALLALAPMIAASQPLEFKGVPFGSSEDQLRAALIETATSFNCYPATGAEPGSTCSVHGITYGEQPTTGTYAHFANGRLSSVMVGMYGGSTRHAIDALASKYGPPSGRKSATKRTKLGVNYAWSGVKWRFKNGDMISVSHDAEPVDVCVVHLQSAANLQAEEKLRAIKPGAKKDI